MTRVHLRVASELFLWNCLKNGAKNLSSGVGGTAICKFQMRPSQILEKNSALFSSWLRILQFWKHMGGIAHAVWMATHMFSFLLHIYLFASHTRQTLYEVVSLVASLISFLTTLKSIFWAFEKGALEIRWRSNFLTEQCWMII